VHEKAAALIDDLIRPLVEADGGRIELVEATSTRVIIRMSGTCAGCPGQPYTLARVIEPAVRRVLGAHVEVEVRSADPLETSAARSG
jgi:Fe-S cluster biogenesis protein NfuA